MFGREAPIKISQSFRDVLQEFEQSEDHLFLTGRAGTGKSTLLKLFIQSTSAACAVVAPTGVAALNAGGQTIHSFFGFHPKMMDPSQILLRRSRRLFEKLDVLVIDEISMVRADLMDCIDYALRKFRKSQRPFGGVRLIMIGDLHQIPPVVPAHELIILQQMGYSSPYFFHANVFVREATFHLIELHEVYRQSDIRFIKLLDQIRHGNIDYEILEDLNTRVIDEDPPQPYITLTAYNRIADTINQRALDEIDQPMNLYPARLTGRFTDTFTPAPTHLECKVGAQVMMLKNDSEQRYVNGSLGTVLSIDADKLMVQITDGDTPHDVEVRRETWELHEYVHDTAGGIKVEKVGSFMQFPIRLAWAITIHKSQGKTLNRALIDLGRGAFSPGQTYVALSRVRSMDGLYLRRPLRFEDIFVDPIIIDAMNDMRRG